MTKVLVVDDSLTQREYISTLVKESAYEVITTHDGEKAIELVSQYPFDSVVVDRIMSRISGYELCIQLKRDPKTKKVPIVMYYTVGNKTGSTDAYLVELFNPAELISRVK